ncbi:ScbA/BarX family gamma-butyrolactone biosynthesis protein [Streptomyces sp. NPDC059009]|uniref:ScbA/BarX family gamma-butyrolactone biosynthesis protein n=1 Tax=Streptomyces sp. NPDC059009 TaxID=3346694 RepID=UPI0036BF652D
MPVSSQLAPVGTSSIAACHVGKKHAVEVLPISWGAARSGAFTVTVQWPENHSFYVEGGSYRPLLVTESLRQAVILLSHVVYDVPLGHRVSMARLWFRVSPAALRVEGGPAEVELVVTPVSVERRRGGSVMFVSSVTAVRDGQFVGEGEIHYGTHPPAIYDRLRGSYANVSETFERAPAPAAPVVPSLVGRTSAKNVVLSPTNAAHQWLLRVDTTHGVLFDHPHDHVPGMVLLEAVDQAARATLGCAGPFAFDTTFHQYVEFDRPCLLRVERAAPDDEGQPRLLVRAFQADRLALSGLVTTAAQPVLAAVPSQVTRASGPARRMSEAAGAMA